MLNVIRIVKVKISKAHAAKVGMAGAWRSLSRTSDHNLDS